MSKTQDLTIGYASFFLGCGKFAILPYTATFFGIAKPSNGTQGPDIARAILVTGILTFAVPVLPVLCSITSALAMVAVALAIATMTTLYLIALLLDVIDAFENPSPTYNMS